MSSDLQLVGAEQLQRFARAVLSSVGVSADQAQEISDGLVFADLSGVSSHGVSRLPQYVESLRSGRIASAPRVEVVRRSSTTALVDAGGGYGFSPTLLASRLAVELAQTSFVSMVGVTRSHHFGMAGIYSAAIADAGLIGLVTTTSTPLLAPPGGTEAVVGNSPISVALPRSGEQPVVLDMALSTAAFGWIRMAAVTQTPIPPDWAFDRQGRPTTDASEAFAARLAQPIGGPKGYGLAVVAAALAGIMTGSGFGLTADAHGETETGDVGHFVMAIRPDAFVAAETYDAGLRELVAQIKAVPTSDPGAGVLLPGEREARCRAERRLHGVPVAADLAARLDELASRLGVAAVGAS